MSRNAMILSRRAIGMAALVAFGSMGGAPVAGASGGGACPPPITNGTVTKARIENFCYEPTVIHVRPGDAVRWINKDRAPHSVTGANRAWGSYKKLTHGGTVAYRFSRAGVYPYYCVFHIGMVGTVVVRDGKLPEPLGRKEASEAVERVQLENLSAASAEGPAVPAADTRSWYAWPIIAATLLGVAALGVTARLRRLRQRSVNPDRD